MLKLIEAKPLPGYRLRISYEDGVVGEVFPNLKKATTDA